MKRKFFLLFIITALLATSLIQTSQPPTLGPHPTLFASQNQDDLAALFKNAIEKSQQSIFLAIFDLSDRSLIKALNEASKRGVDVTLLYDAKHTQTPPSALHSLIHLLPIHQRGLMHRKILIIDNEEIWLGSANFTFSSLHMHDNLIVGMHSKELADILLTHSKRSFPLSNHEFEVDDQRIECWMLPEDLDAKDRLIRLIESAKKTIRVAMFTWTDKRLTEGIVQAAMRGVDVEVALEQNSSGVEKTKKMLSSHGVKVHVSSKQGLLHHKFMWLDEKTLVLGSANWTLSAFSKNRDCFLILHDLDERQVKTMNQLWKVIKVQAPLVSFS